MDKKPGSDRVDFRLGDSGLQMPLFHIATGSGSAHSPRVLSAGDGLHSPRVLKNALPLKVRVRGTTGAVGALHAGILDLEHALGEYRKAAGKIKEEFGTFAYRGGEALLVLTYWVSRRVSDESSALRWRWRFSNKNGHHFPKDQVFLSLSFYEVMASPKHPQYPLVSSFLAELAALGEEQVRRVFAAELQRIEINNAILECRLAIRNAQRLVGDMELEQELLR